MNEREAREYIESINGLGIVPGLDSIRELCERLGNPQNCLKFIHIAGTNGKGSVSTYIASVLKAAGYRVGRYISPTIFDYRERIQVNDRNISKEALGRLMSKAKEACDEMVRSGKPQPTPFEVETALGFLYFLEKKCDYVVLEVGMGGRLDATNIIENKELAVLVSISMDHMKFLGNSLEEIAAEKAGILKPGCRVVSAKQEEVASKVILQQSEVLGCGISFVEPDKITHVRYGLEKQRFDYAGYKGLEIALAGKFQIENAALAVEAVEALRASGLKITEKHIRDGLLAATWPARFAMVGKRPYFITDGAHNEDAAKRLAESLEFYFTNKRIIYIMGVLRDKEYTKIISLTHRLADHIITVTPPDNPRAMSAYELAEEIAKVHPKVTAADSLEEAVEMSRLLAGKEDCIVAFGSLSFQGKLAEIIENTAKKKK